LIFIAAVGDWSFRDRDARSSRDVAAPTWSLALGYWRERARLGAAVNIFVVLSVAAAASFGSRW
jgi:hypothetical protein